MYLKKIRIFPIEIHDYPFKIRDRLAFLQFLHKCLFFITFTTVLECWMHTLSQCKVNYTLHCMKERGFLEVIAVYLCNSFSFSNQCMYYIMVYGFVIESCTQLHSSLCINNVILNSVHIKKCNCPCMDIIVIEQTESKKYSVYTV